MSIEITWNRQDISRIWTEQRVPNGTRRPKRAKILKEHYNKFHNVPLDTIEHFLEIQRQSKTRDTFTESYDAAETDENEHIDAVPNDTEPTTTTAVQPLQSHRSLTGKLMASRNANIRLQQTNQELQRRLISIQQELRTQQALAKRNADTIRNLQNSLSTQRDLQRQSLQQSRKESNEKINKLKAALHRKSTTRSILTIENDTTNASLATASSPTARMFFKRFQ